MKDKTELRQKIGEFVPKIESAQHLYQLFELLGYPANILFDTKAKRKIEEFDLKREEREKVRTIYNVLSFGKDLPVFLLETNSLATSSIKYIAKIFSERYIRVLLILTTDYEQIIFVLPDYDKRTDKDEFKLRITKLILNKNEDYYTDKETLANLYYEGTEPSWRDVWKKWKEAFNVEKVTEQFFDDYKTIFLHLREIVHKQLRKREKGRIESHEFTLQLLNRIMFIYFISKKKWLHNDPKFMKYFWGRYRKDVNAGKSKSDTFYEVWLKTIFFKAFKNQHHEIRELPPDVKEILEDAPYLNGGLFNETKEDDLPIELDDSLFENIFEKFFEKYNFTIKEDMPLESEVAVDPQMLGYVYESLANVAEEIYDKNDLGIFYTPRVEVDFMCRRSLVEYLAKQLPDVPKDKYYELVFNDDTEKVEQFFQDEKLWYKLEEVLDRLSVVDPACGSGAFLVGMVRLLVQMYNLIYKHTSRQMTDFELKEKIIGKSIYGVDVIPWAVHAAELRLWLQLVVETDFKKEELKQRPLLPNLNLNLRVGDSLVQEIGGLNLSFRNLEVSETMKGKLYDLKSEKEDYFHNLRRDELARKQILEREIRIFTEIIDERIGKLLEDMKKLQTKFNVMIKTAQKDLYGAEQKVPEEEIQKVRDQVDFVEKQIHNLKEVKKNLGNPEKKPFVWEIDFAEIFGGKGGFDIVIGNPPYVTRTNISPPNRIKKEVTKNERDEYKRKLINSVKTIFPFVGDIGTMSDLYIYFYFHGLSLLNEKGTFCFISSNSWLSVGFGKILRDFLAKNTHIIGVFDSNRRSFEHAKINTVIVFLGPVKNRIALEDFTKPKNQNDGSPARFILLKKGFDEAVSSENLITVENTNTNLRNSDLALYVINKHKLTHQHGEKLTKTEQVISENWNLFKAPDIFFKIIENSKIVELSVIGDLKVGFRTGANEFYYLTKEKAKKAGIEKEFLRPLVSSPKECKSVYINEKELRNLVFICNNSKSELKGTNALKYIESSEKEEIVVKKGPEKGEKIIGYQNLELIRLSSRKYWYFLGEPEKPYLLLPLVYYKRPVICINGNAFNDVNLVGLHPRDKHRHPGLALSLLSTFNFMNWELFGIANLGEGSLKLNPSYLIKSRIIDPTLLKDFAGLIGSFAKREFLEIFEECGIDASRPIREQLPKPMPDRAELDRIIFDQLDLTKEERKEVYWSVCELVKQRLEKAKSLDRK